MCMFKNRMILAQKNKAFVDFIFSRKLLKVYSSCYTIFYLTINAAIPLFSSL